MRDYENVVLDLRERASSYEQMFGEGESSIVMKDAADAIEELVAMRNVLKSRLAQLEKAEYESGDCAETYKSGFLVGKRQGAIELLREILGIDVDDPPKEVLPNGDV